MACNYCFRNCLVGLIRSSKFYSAVTYHQDINDLDIIFSSYLDVMAIINDLDINKNYLHPLGSIGSIGRRKRKVKWN